MTTNDERDRIAAALLSPAGAVVSVIVIVRATDEQLRAAKRAAAARGFTLHVHEGVRMCADPSALRAAILNEA